MSLDTIWDDPIATPLSATAPNADANADTSPLKRPRQSLFLSVSDSDDDHARPSKRATPAPPSDVDALFDDLDNEGEEDDDLRYKPLAPALDVTKLAKEAEARARQTHTHTQTAPSQTLGGGSKAGAATGVDKDPSGKDTEKDKGKSGGRKTLPKLDEERLVGPEGFPSLIKDVTGFRPKGKGQEHTDLSRMLQKYQFWTHKMYPKMSFKDTVNRVEKLCHSKRMQVRLSVWRDEFNGVTKDTQSDDDPDVIDLTEPTLVATEDDGNNTEDEDTQRKGDQASSRPGSLPPTSSEPEDDDFDIDAIIRAEEERLASYRATTADAGSRLPSSPALPKKALSKSGPDVDAMDLDEASLWDTVDNSETLFDPPHPTSAQPGDDDMWDIMDEMEQGQQSGLVDKNRIPTSGVNLEPSLDSIHSGNTPRATNDDDWDQMYS